MNKSSSSYFIGGKKMFKVEKIVDEIVNNGELMTCFESVTAIDDETILITRMDTQPGELTRVIKDNGCRIKDEQDYSVINGETFDSYYWSVIHKWVNDHMPENVSHWSEEGRKAERKLKKQFFKENSIIKIRIIKIEPYNIDIDQEYKEWRERHKNDFTAKDLIKELEKLDPDTIVCGMDNEYGEYKINYVSDIHTTRSCPDCDICGCVRCHTRKMFERKYVVLE